MQILFIDESGTPPPAHKAADTGYFVLGGVVVPEEVWVKLAHELKRLKAAYSVRGEVKWRHFAPDKGGRQTPLSHLSPELKAAFRSDLYKALVAFKSVKIISVVVHVALEYQRGYVNTPDDMYWLAYKQLTERFQYYLQDLSKLIGHTVHGIVVCDNRGAADDENLRKLHSKLMQGGSDNGSNYANLIEGCFIAPSHMSVGIQFADLVAGAIFRKFKSSDCRFYDQISAAVRTSPAGKVEGFGIVKSPRGNW